MRLTALFGLVPILLLLSTDFVSAQEGIVVYSHTFKILYGKDATSAVMEIDAQRKGEEYSAGPEHAMESRTLAFQPRSSLMYRTQVDSFSIGGRPHVEHTDTTFIDLEKGIYLQWVDFKATAYLVSDQLPEFSWHLTNETRTYLDYRVLKATALIDSSIVEAWFTPDIPVSAGPGLYNGLPGLILLVTHEAIGEVYSAESIDLKVHPNIVAPSTGRAVSAEEYYQIKKSRMERSRRLYDNLMRTIIR